MEKFKFLNDFFLGKKGWFVFTVWVVLALIWFLSVSLFFTEDTFPKYNNISTYIFMLYTSLACFYFSYVSLLTDYREQRDKYYNPVKGDGDFLEPYMNQTFNRLLAYFSIVGFAYLGYIILSGMYDSY